ncbi:hypothetical protein B0O99DRAFT_636199 [Bisporella sp. PMI_857]|nr:hypothetical protein B0O99DRAFT_636199 [Bisporella sp. PMI_857]
MVTQLGENISKVRYETLELDDKIEISQQKTQNQTGAPKQTDISKQLQSSPTTVIPFDNDLANKAFLATHHHLSNGHLELTTDMGRLISRAFELLNRRMRRNKWHTCLERYFDDNAALMSRFEQAAAAYTRKMETLGIVYNNRVAQDNNAIGLAIAVNSHRLSSENARDSAAMKVIAFLANLLLPSSFLWSLYSAPIVEGRVRWWYYLFSIPITLSFFAVWLVWYSRLDWTLVKKENNANREMEKLSLQYRQIYSSSIETEQLWSHKMWEGYERWLSKLRKEKRDDKV